MKRSLLKLRGLSITLVIIFAISGFVFPQTVQAQETPQQASERCQRENPDDGDPDTTADSIGYINCVTAAAARGQASQATQQSVCKIGNLLNANITTEPECGTAGGTLVQPNTQQSEALQQSQTNNENPSWWVEKVIQPAFAWVIEIILKLVSLLTGVGGLILNGAIYHTVVNMSQNYKGITGIGEAWKTIRDLANIAFIFILLYAAIQTILGIGKDTNKLVVNVIVIAILINFSLFFTQLVIDAANVLTLLFYDAMVPNAAAKGLTGAGLSNAFMQHLNLQNLYYAKDAANLTIPAIITTGVMGSIMLLIAAFVFFAAGLLFIIRYVVLIVVLILSPIAFLAFVLPQLKKYADQWKDALIGQAFFAPIYMALTWITLKILGGVTSAFGESGTLASIGTAGEASGSGLGNINQFQGFFPTFINFVVVIAFLIISLIIAKEWASKLPGGGGKLVSAALGFAGGATLGMAGRLGRNTVGAGASRLAQSEGFQRFAGKSVVGQFALNKTNQAARSSFDFRATRAGQATVGEIGAGAAKQGGFEARLQEKIAKKDKFAQTLRTKDAKEAYAKRIAGGKLTHGGTRNSGNSIFGTLGRHNRVVASKIYGDRLTQFQTDLKTGNTDLGRYQNIINQYISAHPAVPPLTPAVAAPLALNPTQLTHHSTLIGGGPGSLTAMNTEITRVQGEIDTLELTKTPGVGQTDYSHKINY